MVRFSLAAFGVPALCIFAAAAIGYHVGHKRGYAAGVARAEELVTDAQLLSLEAMTLAERCLRPGIGLLDLQRHAKQHPFFIRPSD